MGSWRIDWSEHISRVSLIGNLYIKVYSFLSFLFCQYFPSIFTFFFYKKKSPLYRLVKNFLSSKRDLKCLSGSSHPPHMSPSFINHFLFLNIKIPNKIFHFDLLTIVLVESTSTCHYSKIKKIKIEEWNIYFDMWTCAFNKDNFTLITATTTWVLPLPTQIVHCD